MADMRAIHEFALHWFKVFNSPETTERATFQLGEDCLQMEFEMDSAKSFRKEFSEDDFLNPIAFHDIVHLIDDVEFLGCAIHSKYRLLTHWWNQDCTEPRNRAWFKVRYGAFGGTDGSCQLC